MTAKYPDDVTSRLTGITTALGLPWTPEYRQQVFDTAVEARDVIGRLRAALRPFAEVPPGGRGPGARMMVVFAGDGPFHFFEEDLTRAKELFRDNEQKEDQK